MKHCCSNCIKLKKRIETFKQERDYLNRKLSWINDKLAEEARMQRLLDAVMESK